MDLQMVDPDPQTIAGDSVVTFGGGDTWTPSAPTDGGD